MNAVTITLQPGPNPFLLKLYLDIDTAQRITGPEYHYSIAYDINPDGRDEYNILVNGDYAGEINLYHQGDTAHVGFWLRDRYRGCGAIPEALRLMLAIYWGKFAFINMTCWVNNQPGMALLDKLGMIERRRVRYPRRNEDQFGEWASFRRTPIDLLDRKLNLYLKAA